MVERLRSLSPKALRRILCSGEILPGLKQALGPVPTVGDEVVDLAVTPAAKLVQYRHAPRRVGLDLHVEPVDDDLLLVGALTRRELVPRREQSGEGIDHWRSSSKLDMLPEAERAGKPARAWIPIRIAIHPICGAYFPSFQISAASFQSFPTFSQI